MRKLIALAVVLALTGCETMSAREKTTWLVIGGLAVGAVVISSSSGSSTPPKQVCTIIIEPGGGSTRAC